MCQRSAKQFYAILSLSLSLACSLSLPLFLSFPLSLPSPLSLSLSFSLSLSLFLSLALSLSLSARPSRTMWTVRRRSLSTAMTKVLPLTRHSPRCRGRGRDSRAVVVLPLTRQPRCRGRDSRAVAVAVDVIGEWHVHQYVVTRHAHSVFRVYAGMAPGWAADGVAAGPSDDGIVVLYRVQKDKINRVWVMADKEGIAKLDTTAEDAFKESAAFGKVSACGIACAKVCTFVCSLHTRTLAHFSTFMHR